jgi:hypothetical protein
MGTGTVGWDAESSVAQPVEVARAARERRATERRKGIRAG